MDGYWSKFLSDLQGSCFARSRSLAPFHWHGLQVIKTLTKTNRLSGPRPHISKPDFLNLHLDTRLPRGRFNETEYVEHMYSGWPGRGGHINPAWRKPITCKWIVTVTVYIDKIAASHTYASIFISFTFQKDRSSYVTLFFFYIESYPPGHLSTSSEQPQSVPLPDGSRIQLRHHGNMIQTLNFMPGFPLSISPSRWHKSSVDRGLYAAAMFHWHHKTWNWNLENWKYWNLIAISSYYHGNLNFCPFLETPSQCFQRFDRSCQRRKSQKCLGIFPLGL
jgi:hypothetical protein